MATLKELLDAYGKASSRNSLPLADPRVTIVPDYKNWDYRFYPTADGILGWFVKSAVDVSVVGGYSSIYLRGTSSFPYFGGYCFLKKGYGCQIFFEQSDTTAEHKFWFQPLRYES